MEMIRINLLFELIAMITIKIIHLSCNLSKSGLLYKYVLIIAYAYGRPSTFAVSLRSEIQLVASLKAYR